MLAAVLEKINSPLSIKEVELTDLSIGQVLVRVLVSGICGSQIQEIKGFKGNEKFLPHLMGHEGCGIVESVGPGVKNVKVGDKVVMHWRVGVGIESDFPSYILDGKKISSGKVTTLSQYSIVSENRLTVVPGDSDEYFCALLGCGLTTALGIINNELDLKFGESLAVVGCGGVGLNLLQGAAMASAYPVIGIDVSEEKRKKVFDAKATYFINSKKESLREKLNSILPKGKIDVIVDTTGNSEIIEEMSTYLSDSGRLILVGQPRPDEKINLSGGSSLFGTKGKTIKTTQGGKTSPSEDIQRYIKLHKAGLLDIEKIISHKYSLNEINEAFDLLKTGNAGRIMINIGK